MTRRDYGSGTIEERSPGRWRVTVEFPRDPVAAKRRRNRFTIRGSKRDAQRALRDALGERDHGVDITPAKITVADWLTRWLPRHHAEGHINDRTLERYGGIVNGHLIPSFGQLRLKDLRADQVTDVKVRWLLGEKSTAAHPLSGATVHKHLNILRRALSDAVASGLLSRNPLDAVTSPSTAPASEQRALTEQEVDLLIAAAGDGRYAVPLRFTLATGLRQGEMLALEWADVDLDSAVMTVRGTKTQNSRRTIELSGTTVAQLRSHRQAQRHQRLRLGSTWQENGLVFPSRIGTPWLRRPFYRDYKAVVAESDVGDPASVKWHTLRHSAATLWIKGGVDIYTVSRRLGHSSAAFSMDVYGHLLKGQQRHAAEVLDGLLA